MAGGMKPRGLVSTPAATEKFMSLALAQLLPEFDLPARARPAPRAIPHMPQPVEPDPDLIAAVREEARAEGRREAERELSLQHGREIADLEAGHARAMALREAELVRNVAEALPAAIVQRAEELAVRLSAELSDMLAPLIEAELRKTMVTSLAQEIRAALDLETAGRISVSGPAIWLDTIRPLIGEGAETVSFVEADRADVEVSIDETRLRSRFVELSKSFAEASP
jgi:hypothetical protein